MASQITRGGKQPSSPPSGTPNSQRYEHEHIPLNSLNKQGNGHSLLYRLSKDSSPPQDRLGPRLEQVIVRSWLRLGYVLGQVMFYVRLGYRLVQVPGQVRLDQICIGWLGWSEISLGADPRCLSPTQSCPGQTSPISIRFGKFCYKLRLCLMTF